jgi:uncharacterized protein (TIRG00374 family)
LSLIRFCGRWIAKHQNWLKWLVAVGVLGFLFHLYGDTFRTLNWSQVHWGAMLLAVLLFTAAQLLTFFRWFLLVWSQDFPFTYREAVRLGFIGLLFNYAAPSAVGGDLVKASLLARQQRSRRTVAVATIIIDRILGLIGLIVVGAAAMWLVTPLRENPAFAPVAATFQVAALVTIGGLVLCLLPYLGRITWVERIGRLPKFGPVLLDLLNSMRLYQTRWHVVATATALSLLSHVVTILSVYAGAVAIFGIDGSPGLTMQLQIVPPAELAGVLIPLPGGTGALEGAMALLYDLAGRRRDEGFSVGIVFRVVTIITAMVGAGYYLASRREIDNALAAAPPDPDEPAVPVRPEERAESAQSARPA